jgi:hypothetical protein
LSSADLKYLILRIIPEIEITPCNTNLLPLKHFISKMRKLTPITLVIYMACGCAWGGSLNLHDAIFQTTVLKITRENQYIISKQLPQAS